MPNSPAPATPAAIEIAFAAPLGAVEGLVVVELAVGEPVPVGPTIGGKVVLCDAMADKFWTWM